MPELLPQHLRLIEESAISPEVARERGYFSAAEKSQLESLGFRPYQQRVPAMVVPIWNVHGQIAFYQIRPDQPRITDSGRELRYETPAGVRLVVDVPPAARDKLGDPKVPLWITEGSRKADAAVSAGSCCVGLAGVWGWRGTNEDGGKTALACWESIALNRRVVYIAFDSDVMTKQPVELALMALRKFLKSRGAKVQLVYLPQSEDGEKVGLDDFLAAGHTVKDLLACVDAGGTTTARSDKKESQAKHIIDLVGVADVELFHDSEPKAYITFTVRDHRETHTLDSSALRRWLAHEYYQRHGTSPRPEAINMARLTLEGRAHFDGPEHDVHVRIAQDRGAVVIDLADERWRVVRIDAAGWNVLTSSPVRFRRPAGMHALPVPERGGSIESLRDFVNIGSNQDFALLVGWLIAAFRPRGPYPVLVIQGEQGSAKSTTSRVLRRLIDPNKAALRAQPRDPRDIAIAANNAWCITLDNLSSVPNWLSDGLCRFATGGGFATRALYTNSEECLLDAQRPIILNGIDSVATRGDLLDRAVLLTLPRLDRVREESDFWTEFDAEQPRLLGALFDAISTALRWEPEIKLGVSVRMMDAARWVAAAEPSLPWTEGTFLEAYVANRADSNELALEASPVAAEIRRFVARYSPWEGTAGELLEELDRQAGDGVKKLKVWPKTPRGLSGALRRLAPNLRAVEIQVHFLGKHGRGKNRTRRLRMEVAPQPSPPSPPADPLESGPKSDSYEGAVGDASEDGRTGSAASDPHDRPPVATRDPSKEDGGVDEDGHARTPGQDLQRGSEWGEL